MNTNKYLDQLHNEKLKELVPVIVIIAVLMVVGLVGNVSVLLFYWRQTRRSSTTVFIIVLAGTDFLVCCVMTLEIIDVANTYVFKNDVACKLYIYANHIAATASGFILVIIAVDRYRKLCWSLKRQLTIKQAKIICVISLGISLLLSLPVFILYETTSVPVSIHPYNITVTIYGSDCTTKTENDKFKEILHYIFLGVFSICTITLIVLYTLIGRIIYRYHKNHQYFQRDLKQANAQDQVSTSSAGKTSENVENPPNHASCTDIQRSSGCSESNAEIISTKDFEEQTGDTSNSGVHLPSSNGKRSTDPSAAKVQDRASSSSSTHSSDTLAKDARKGNDRTDKNTAKRKANKKYKKTIAAMKMTIMLFVIAIVFIASFVPYQTVSTLGHGEYKETVSFELALRSYLLNSVINPFIYGLFNVEFRRSFKNVVICVWKRCASFLPCNKAWRSNEHEVQNFDSIQPTPDS